MTDNPTYTEATQKAIAALSSEHAGLFLCIARTTNDRHMNMEIISGIDSDSVACDNGAIRLQQAAMHVQYLCDVSGLSPREVANAVARSIEDGDIEIGENVLKK